MSINHCREWQLVGKLKMEAAKAALDPAAWEKVKEFIERVEADPFDDELQAEMVPGNAPVNTRCRFVPGTNVVVTWLITIRQCSVTILEIEDVGDLA